MANIGDILNEEEQLLWDDSENSKDISIGISVVKDSVNKDDPNQNNEQLKDSRKSEKYQKGRAKTPSSEKSVKESPMQSKDAKTSNSKTPIRSQNEKNTPSKTEQARKATRKETPKQSNANSDRKAKDSRKDSSRQPDKVETPKDLKKDNSSEQKGAIKESKDSKKDASRQPNAKQTDKPTEMSQQQKESRHTVKSSEKAPTNKNPPSTEKSKTQGNEKKEGNNAGSAKKDSKTSTKKETSIGSSDKKDPKTPTKKEASIISSDKKDLKTPAMKGENQAESAKKDLKKSTSNSDKVAFSSEKSKEAGKEKPQKQNTPLEQSERKAEKVKPIEPKSERSSDKPTQSDSKEGKERAEKKTDSKEGKEQAEKKAAKQKESLNEKGRIHSRSPPRQRPTKSPPRSNHDRLPPNRFPLRGRRLEPGRGRGPRLESRRVVIQNRPILSRSLVDSRSNNPRQNFPPGPGRGLRGLRSEPFAQGPRGMRGGGRGGRGFLSDRGDMFSRRLPPDTRPMEFSERGSRIIAQGPPKDRGAPFRGEEGRRIPQQSLDDRSGRYSERENRKRARSPRTLEKMQKDLLKWKDKKAKTSKWDEAPQSSQGFQRPDPISQRSLRERQHQNEADKSNQLRGRGNQSSNLPASAIQKQAGSSSFIRNEGRKKQSPDFGKTDLRTDHQDNSTWTSEHRNRMVPKEQRESPVQKKQSSAEYPQNRGSGSAHAGIGSSQGSHGYLCPKCKQPVKTQMTARSDLICVACRRGIPQGKIAHCCPLCRLDVCNPCLPRLLDPKSQRELQPASQGSGTGQGGGANFQASKSIPCPKCTESFKPAVTIRLDVLCSPCRKPIPRGSRTHSCAACNFDICQNCYTQICLRQSQKALAEQSALSGGTQMQLSKGGSSNTRGPGGDSSRPLPTKDSSIHDVSCPKCLQAAIIYSKSQSELKCDRCHQTIPKKGERAHCPSCRLYMCEGCMSQRPSHTLQKESPSQGRPGSGAPTGILEAQALNLKALPCPRCLKTTKIYPQGNDNLTCEQCRKPMSKGLRAYCQSCHLYVCSVCMQQIATKLTRESTVSRVPTGGQTSSLSQETKEVLCPKCEKITRSFIVSHSDSLIICGPCRKPIAKGEKGYTCTSCRFDICQPCMPQVFRAQFQVQNNRNEKTEKLRQEDAQLAVRDKYNSSNQSRSQQPDGPSMTQYSSDKRDGRSVHQREQWQSDEKQPKGALDRHRQQSNSPRKQSKISRRRSRSSSQSRDSENEATERKRQKKYPNREDVRLETGKKGGSWQQQPPPPPSRTVEMVKESPRQPPPPPPRPGQGMQGAPRNLPTFQAKYDDEQNYLVISNSKLAEGQRRLADLKSKSKMEEAEYLRQKADRMKGFSSASSEIRPESTQKTSSLYRPSSDARNDSGQKQAAPSGNRSDSYNTNVSMAYQKDAQLGYNSQTKLPQQLSISTALASTAPQMPEQLQSTGGTTDLRSRAIYAYNLPTGLTDQRIISFFSGFGPCTEIRVLPDFETNGRSNIAYVSYTTVGNAFSCKRSLETQPPADALEILVDFYAGAPPNSPGTRILKLETSQSSNGVPPGPPPGGPPSRNVPPPPPPLPQSNYPIENMVPGDSSSGMRMMAMDKRYEEWVKLSGGTQGMSGVMGDVGRLFEVSSGSDGGTRQQPLGNIDGPATQSQSMSPMSTNKQKHLYHFVS